MGYTNTIWFNLHYACVWSSLWILLPLGLCPTVDLGLLRERRIGRQECCHACCVQGSNSPWCCEFCSHQHAQEQPPAICSQRTGRWVCIQSAPNSHVAPRFSICFFLRWRLTSCTHKSVILSVSFNSFQVTRPALSPGVQEELWLVSLVWEVVVLTAQARVPLEMYPSDKN